MTGIGQFNTVWNGSEWVPLEVAFTQAAAPSEPTPSYAPIIDYQPEPPPAPAPANRNPVPMPAQVVPVSVASAPIISTPAVPAADTTVAHIDYNGNKFDAAGKYLGTDYYAGQGWKDAKAANDNLQVTVEVVRKIEDAITTQGSHPDLTNALNEAAAHVTDALHGYELGTSGGHLGAPAAKQGVDQTATAATNAVNTASSVGITITTPVTPHTPVDSPQTPSTDGGSAIPLLAVLYGLWRAFS